MPRHLQTSYASSKIESSLFSYCKLSSTLANSYGVGERIRHAVPDMAWNFDSVSVRP